MCLTQPDRTVQVTKWLLSFHLIKTEKEDFPLIYFLCNVVEEKMTLETQIQRNYMM